MVFTITIDINIKLRRNKKKINKFKTNTYLINK